MAERKKKVKPGAGAAAPAEPQRFTPRVSSAYLERLAGRAACGPERQPLDVEMPFSGETLGNVPAGTPDDVRAAVAAAREAQRGWAATPAAERARVLLRFHDLLIANAHEALDLIQLELGKARKHAFDEVLDAAITARYYAHIAADALRPRLRQGAFPVFTVTREYRRPKGVVGFISPWNFPLILGITDALAALAAGNAVVIKPDAQTPFSCLWAAALLEEAGLPRDLVQVVTGRGRELGPTLIDEVDHLMFTGSTATGRLLAQQAAGRLIDFSLELGGKNPALVLDDAPLGRTVAGLRLGVGAVDGLCFAVTTGCGQVCISTERLFVQSGIYDDLMPRLTDALTSLRLGSSLNFSDDLGCLSSAEQLDKVKAHVDDAVAKGARVLTGGRERPDLGPYFYEPTLLEGVTEEMAVCREETFGPVCSVYRFDDVDEAVARVNDTEYGLSASIWTRDWKRARGLAARIEAGIVTVNDAYQAAWASASPMGGCKQSGVGRRHGRDGLLKFTEPQTVAAEWGLAVDHLPFGDHELYAKLMSATIRLLKYVPGIK